MFRPEKLKSHLAALQKGDLTLQGQFEVGSNYTFLGSIRYLGETIQVVYKPDRGEQPLWDFPPNTLARREVAAFLVSHALKWHLVPPTVYRKDGPLGSGSVQLFLDHDPSYHFFTFRPEHKARLMPVAAFDIVINNADRKGGHILVDGEDHIWLIDHGVSFHCEDKLRTVVWDFAGLPLPDTIRKDLAGLANRLEHSDDSLRALLDKVLAPDEVDAVGMRIRSLLEAGVFPAPASDRRPYPWPPI